MNKKLKKIIVVGTTVLITASSVGFSNAMQVKKICNLKQNNKVYICLNGKINKLDFKCISMFDILKWFDKNNYENEFPSIDNNQGENIGDNNNQDENTEDSNQGNDNNQNQDKEDNNLGNDNNQNQDKEDNNLGNGNNQNQDKEDNNLGNGNNQNQDKEDNNLGNGNSQNQDKEDNNDFSKEQVEVLNLVNKERKANGLKSLTLNKELSNVANIKSKDMIEKGYFDHTSPTYGSPFDMMKTFNISYKTAGENIAMGQKTPSEVMTSWMNSSGHRANILNSSFTELGVGIQKDSNGRIYWTQMFIGK